MICYMSRQNVAIAVVSMISDKPPETSYNKSLTSWNSADSCPFPTNVTTGEQIRKSTSGPKYNWTNQQRALIISAFFWVYVTCQVPAARLAETIGAKWVLAAAGIGSAIISFVLPWAASVHLYLFVFFRALLGLAQAGTFPACYELYSKWLLPKEQALAIPLLRTGMYTGAMLTSTTSGYLSEQNAYGWPYAFYLSGFICALWSLFWVIFATSKPEDSKYISQEELNIIKLNKSKRGSQEQSKLDWWKLFSSPQVIALIACYFSSDWSSTNTLQLMPTYLNDVLHIPPFKNGIINSIIFFIICFTAPTVGTISSLMITKRTCGLSSLQVRRLFQLTALFGQTVCLLILPATGCSIELALYLLYTQVFLGGFTNGGQTQIPFEISPLFSGTVYAIANSIGSATGFISPIVFGQLVEDTGSRDDWNKHFKLSASITAIGGLVFLAIGGNEQEDLSKASEDPHALRDRKRDDVEMQEL